MKMCRSVFFLLKTQESDFPSFSFFFRVGFPAEFTDSVPNFDFDELRSNMAASFINAELMALIAYCLLCLIWCHKNLS